MPSIILPGNLQGEPRLFVGPGLERDSCDATSSVNGWFKCHFASSRALVRPFSLAGPHERAYQLLRREAAIL